MGLKFNPLSGQFNITGASGGGSGTVTSTSVVSANGFGGSVATSTTTPAITINTSVTGVLKGNGTAISAATSGTDYSAGTSALTTGILKSTTTTGALTIAVAGDFPTLNQNTTGTAAGLSATLAIGSGGTGQTSANNALNALLPSQTSNSGKFLTTNGTNASWATTGGGVTISPVQAVDVIAVSAITLSGEQTIDNFTTSASRVAVVGQGVIAGKDPTDGIYITGAGAWTRATDMNSGSQLYAGMSFKVLNGDTYGGTEWYLFTEGPYTLGTTPLQFEPSWSISPAAGTVGFKIISSLSTLATGQPTIVNFETSNVSGAARTYTVKFGSGQTCTYIMPTIGNSATDTLLAANAGATVKNKTFDSSNSFSGANISGATVSPGVLVLPTDTSDPSTSNPDGMTYYNTSTNNLRVLNGGTWRGVALT